MNWLLRIYGCVDSASIAERCRMEEGVQPVDPVVGIDVDHDLSHSSFSRSGSAAGTGEPSFKKPSISRMNVFDSTPFVMTMAPCWTVTFTMDPRLSPASLRMASGITIRPLESMMVSAILIPPDFPLRTLKGYRPGVC